VIVLSVALSIIARCLLPTSLIGRNRVVGVSKVSEKPATYWTKVQYISDTAFWYQRSNLER
jgi:hypothetical protein